MEKRFLLEVRRDSDSSYQSVDEANLKQEYENILQKSISCINIVKNFSFEINFIEALNPVVIDKDFFTVTDGFGHRDY